jgi:hypothetical protein
MRTVCLLLFASVLPASGCAALIAQSGTDLTPLTTKAEIHAALGEPAVSGVSGGQPFEEYRTRRKIADRPLGEGYAIALVETLGAIDLICVPAELYLTGRRTLLGQTIRVTYDSTDKVAGLYRDGESLYFWGNPLPAESPASDVPTQATPPDHAQAVLAVSGNPQESGARTDPVLPGHQHLEPGSH